MDWMPLGVVGVIFTLACAAFIRPSARSPKATPLPPDLRAQLGPRLAAWLEATRALRVRMLTFERHITTMLREELDAISPTGRRAFGRDIDDVQMLDEVSQVRHAGQAWIQHSLELTDAERAGLRLDLQAWKERFAFPWRSDDDASRADRSLELRELWRLCAAAGQALAELDDHASAGTQTPYRRS